MKEIQTDLRKLLREQKSVGGTGSGSGCGGGGGGGVRTCIKHKIPRGIPGWLVSYPCPQLNAGLFK